MIRATRISKIRSGIPQGGNKTLDSVTKERKASGEKQCETGELEGVCGRGGGGIAGTKEEFDASSQLLVKVQ